MILGEEQIEAICREICAARNINPDGDGYGMGYAMPAGDKFKLWEAQRSVVELVVRALAS